MSTPLSRFRAVAVYEGISFVVLLFIAMPLKYMLKVPELVDYVAWANGPALVKYVGWAHGALFVMYIATLAHVFFADRWSIVKAIVAFLASLVPFGTFWLDKKLKREEEAKQVQHRERQLA